MRIETVLLRCCTFFVVAACHPAVASLGPAQRSAVADSVRRATSEFSAAASAVDADRLFALYSNTPDFAAADNGVLYTSVEPLREKYRQIYRGFRAIETHFDTTRVTVLAPDAAVITFSGSVVTIDTAGVRQPPTTLALTLVWVREPAGWRIRQMHQSFLR